MPETTPKLGVVRVAKNASFMNSHSLTGLERLTKKKKKKNAQPYSSAL